MIHNQIKIVLHNYFQARRSSRPKRKLMYIDTYEQLDRDEEKQLSLALKASLQQSEPSLPSQEKKPPDIPVKRGRGRPKSKPKIEEETNLPSTDDLSEELIKEEKHPEVSESKAKRKKTIIRQKSVSGEPTQVKAQRKFASVSANGRKQPVKQKPTHRRAPTIPVSESGDDAPKTEEFVDYLCLRNSVPTKPEWKHFSGDEDSLVIAESDDSATEDGEDFKVFDFDEPPTEDSDSTTDKQKPTKNKRSKSTKKRKLTQNYYNAKLRSSFDNTDNSALASATIFRPTGEEFKNFHAYLEKITPQLIATGMCKVVPPLAWKTPHVLQDDLRFNTKKQEVHRICHRSGPSTTVLKQIKAHLFFDHGFEWKGLPQIGTTIVDLTRLSWLMKKHGGLQVVIDKNKWSKLGDALGIPGVAERNEQLEDVYCKYLLSYDLLSDKEKDALRVDEIDEASEIVESGKKMTLAALRRHDAHARKTRFPSDGVASPTSLELEFWNLVCSAEEHFVSLNGTESTMTHGSGFPAYEPRHIAQSDWNLTNLRHLPDGIMGFLPDVNFVTQPRLELNSLFSVTGWHIEPHFLPLISYNHFSHPRIWYTCAASQSRKFLSALHDIVPRLVNGNHILDPNCVLIPPAEFAAKDITVCRAVQKPGEFIITAPKSYICNFSLGLNINESVNFATEEWLHYCPGSLKLYRDWKLKPPLNIPQIIIDVIERHDSLNEHTLRAAEPHLTTLLKQELEAREKCLLPARSNAQDSKDVFCEHCQTICHLSYVRPCTAKEANVLKMKEKGSKKKSVTQSVFCLNHSSHISNGMMECKVSEEVIKRMLSTLEKRLHPKRSIVHPVQCLARSVCRPQTTPSPIVSKPESFKALPVEVVRDSPPVQTTSIQKSDSPVCPASPAEDELGESHKGLRLVIPSKPLEMCPLEMFPTSPSPNFTHRTPLAKPIPIKPTALPSPIIPSLLVHPQQFNFHLRLPPARPPSLPEIHRPALWESFQPDLQNHSANSS